MQNKFFKRSGVVGQNEPPKGYQKFSKIRFRVISAQFAALIAVGAFIRIPIPFVPFTLQFLFTTLAGSLLGSKYGALSVLLYLGLGLAGLPIFSLGGGPGYIFYPTFGYLLGFCAGAYITGRMVEKSVDVGFKKVLFANFVGLLVVYLFGMVYFYFISRFYIGSPIGFWALLFYCFVLAVPGDIALCFFGAFLYGKLAPFVKYKDGIR